MIEPQRIDENAAEIKSMLGRILNNFNEMSGKREKSFSLIDNSQWHSKVIDSVCILYADVTLAGSLLLYEDVPRVIIIHEILLIK